MCAHIFTVRALVLWVFSAVLVISLWLAALENELSALEAQPVRVSPPPPPTYMRLQIAVFSLDSVQFV